MFFVAARVNFGTCLFWQFCCLVNQLELDRESSFMVVAWWNRRRNVKVATRETLYQQVNISWYFYSYCAHGSGALQLFQVFWNCHGASVWFATSKQLLKTTCPRIFVSYLSSTYPFNFSVFNVFSVLIKG